METLERLRPKSYYEYMSDGEYYKDKLQPYCDEEKVVNEVVDFLGGTNSQKQSKSDFSLSQDEIRLNLDNLLEHIQDDDRFYQSWDGDVQVLLHKDKTYDMCWHHEKLMGEGKDTWDWYGREQGSYSVENEKITFTTVRVCNHNLFGLVADEITKKMKEEPESLQPPKEVTVEITADGESEAQNQQSEKLPEETGLKEEIEEGEPDEPVKKAEVPAEPEPPTQPETEPESPAQPETEPEEPTQPEPKPEEPVQPKDPEPAEENSESDYSDDDLPMLEGAEQEAKPKEEKTETSPQGPHHEHDPSAPLPTSHLGLPSPPAPAGSGDDDDSQKEKKKKGVTFDPFQSDFWGEEDQADKQNVPSIVEDEEVKAVPGVPCPQCGDNLPDIQDLISHLMETHMDMAGFRASMPQPGKHLWKSTEESEEKQTTESASLSTTTDPQPTTSFQQDAPQTDQSDVQPSESKTKEPSPEIKKMIKLQAIPESDAQKEASDKLSADSATQGEEPLSESPPEATEVSTSDAASGEPTDDTSVVLVPAPPPTCWTPVNRQTTGTIDPGSGHVLSLPTHTGQTGPDEYDKRLVRCRLLYPEPEELKLRPMEQSVFACVDEESNPDRVEELEVLLENGVEINCTDEEGNTALHYACKYGHSEIVDLLVMSYPPANLDAKNNNGDTPLMFAAKYNQALLAELLLKLTPAADPTIVNNDGWTPLMVAAKKRFGSTIRVFIEADGVTKSDRWEGIMANSPRYLKDVYRDLTRELRYLEL